MATFSSWDDLLRNVHAGAQTRPNPPQRRTSVSRWQDTTITDVWDFGRPDKPLLVREYRDAYNIHTGTASTLNYLEQREPRAYHEQWHGRSVVTAELVDALVPHMVGRVVEPFAGRGWLAAHLRAAGVELKALDNGSMPVPKTWTVIENLDVVDECSRADTIIMQWPPLHVIAQKIVMRMKKGANLFYLGDGNNSPTPGFWHHLARHTRDRSFEQKLAKTQPGWAGKNDQWQVYIK